MVLNSFAESIKYFPVVIIANGDFPNYEPALNILQSAKVIVCCDGAYENFLQQNINTQAEIVVTGDGDSLSSDLLEKCQPFFIADWSTEYNDLQKALKYCQRKGYQQVLLIGCEGKREDHFIANISIMATYSEQLNLTMLTAHGIFHIIRESATLPSFAGQQVSVFTKDNALPLSFDGLKYPVKERCFQHLWEGSLNEALGDNFTITIHGDGVVIIYQTLQKKD
ncbi:MAG: thiamine diphosphokinase [Bacteroidales bacterium]|nr:thiamine diphosphokinase [Bacteroidales bacterium]